jgi:guanine deaminase
MVNFKKSNIFMHIMKVFKVGLLLNPVKDEDGKIDVRSYRDFYIAVETSGNNKGNIVEVGRADLSSQQKYADAEVIDLSKKVVTPGFVDAHAHLPQKRIMGTSSGVELLPWLNETTLPEEKRFTNLEYAAEVADETYKDAVSVGTTTMCLFGPPLYEATDVAFERAEPTGLRILMGMTLLDELSEDLFPEHQSLNQTIDHAVESTEELYRRWHGKAEGRLQVVPTPRFAVCCSMDLMKEVAKLAEKYELLIQTHLTENLGEIEAIKARFPDLKLYERVYQEAGLMHSKMIFAHVIHSTPEGQALLRKYGPGLVHCPISNEILLSGKMPVHEYRKQRMRIGLATDIGAGDTLSMQANIQKAVEFSRDLYDQAPSDTLDPRWQLDFKSGLYLATQGSADVLHLGDKIGTFKIGKQFDATVFDPEQLCGEEYDLKEPTQLLEKICTQRGKGVEQAYVAGNQVYSV